MASAGGRYFGLVTGGALPAALGAHWLATAWDQNAYSEVSSPAAAGFEALGLSWMKQVLGLPEGAGGAFVTGATMANFSALAAARRAILQRSGWDVEEKGLFGAPPFTVYTSQESHPSVYKALGMLGLGRERVVRLPVDAEGRIQTDNLPAGDGPGILCCQAGNVHSGASDPFTDLRQWCDARGLWMHVDGAFGLWLAASPSLREAVAGVELADSWATDAHKWLNVPYDCGAVVVKDPQWLHGAMAVTAPYLEGSSHTPGDRTPELSRRARSVDVVAALAQLGRAGVIELIEGHVALARRFADTVRAGGLEVLNEVVANQVVIGFDSVEARDATCQVLNASGEGWCGPSEWRGRPGIRVSVSGWRTTAQDVDRAATALLRSQPAPLSEVRAWDLVSEGYVTHHLEDFEWFAEAALAQVPAGVGRQVLDVGAGPGSLALLAARSGAQVEAIDFSITMVERCRTRAVAAGLDTQVRVQVADGQELPFADASFDAAYSMFGLMFFPDRHRGLCELARVVRPGGRVVVSAWRPMGDIPQLAELFPALYQAMPHLRTSRTSTPPMSSPELMQSELEAAGFDAEVVEVTFQRPFASAGAFLTVAREAFAPIRVIEERAGPGFGEVWSTVCAELEGRWGSESLVFPMRALLGVGTLRT